MKKIIFILIILTANNVIIAEQNSKFFSEIEEILPAKEVFKITILENNKNLEINWNIQEGYYLYLDSVGIEIDKNKGKYKIISANLYDHEDEFFGKTKIIRNKLKISINNLEISDNKDIDIYYQGCSDKGFCYPVQNLKI
jgi:thiol:disulfide interchange protein DsbD|tara:strand:- start:88 stop:507 length:420 start_codon:yes stop_codon:yes gene_type:complete